jgi:hypothetical protein
MQGENRYASILALLVFSLFSVLAKNISPYLKTAFTLMLQFLCFLLKSPNVNIVSKALD